MKQAVKGVCDILPPQMWRRLELLLGVLEFGFHVLLTDLDVVWFRDPFPHLPLHTDMSVSCDKWNEEEGRVSPNGGLWFARSNPRTIRFFRFWLEDHATRCVWMTSAFRNVSMDDVSMDGWMDDVTALSLLSFLSQVAGE